jgi:hypothetical protein
VTGESSAPPATPAAAPSTAPPNLTDYPSLYELADSGSKAGQGWYKNLTIVELAFVLFGAVASSLLALTATGDEASAETRSVAIVTAVAFAGALLALSVMRRRGDDDRWFDGRAVAETVKTQTWQYVMRVPPYDDDATADRQFANDVRTTLHERPAVGEFEAVTTGHGQITAQMRELRTLPLEARIELYVRGRLGDQVAWYGHKAAHHRRAADRWSIAALVTESLALISALVAIFSDTIAQLGFVGVLASAAAAFTAWNELGRNGEVARAYGLANQELLAIESLGQAARTEADLIALVSDGESAISREHTMWVAKRANPVESTGSSIATAGRPAREG